MNLPMVAGEASLKAKHPNMQPKERLKDPLTDSKKFVFSNLILLKLNHHNNTYYQGLVDLRRYQALLTTHKALFPIKIKT